jgi:hypothetical protein
MRKKDHDDPFHRNPTTSQRSIKMFRQQHVLVRYSLVFVVGFIAGSIIEFFACKTRLYESVMANKDSRRHQMDEFVVDFRRNMDKWQREDMKSQSGGTTGGAA